MDSPIHRILNEIRIKYAETNVSVVDIHHIEKDYSVCSILNVRNETTAFLRITYFGSQGTVFEDIVLDFSGFKGLELNENLLFRLSQLLYNQAYGVVLKKSKKPLITEYFSPSLDCILSDSDKKPLLTQEENRSAKTTGIQQSLFDKNN